MAGRDAIKASERPSRYVAERHGADDLVAVEAFSSAVGALAEDGALVEGAVWRGSARYRGRFRAGTGRAPQGSAAG